METTWKQRKMRRKPGLCPVISSTCLTEHKVVWAEQLAEGSGTNAVHGACSMKKPFHSISPQRCSTDSRHQSLQQTSKWVRCQNSVSFVSMNIMTHSWLKIHQDGTRHVASTCCLVEVHVDALLERFVCNGHNARKVGRRHAKTHRNSLAPSTSMQHW